MRTLLPFPELGAAKCVQGKESICVDLSTEEGRAIVHALARRVGHRAAVVPRRCGRRARGSTPTRCVRSIPDLVYLNSPGYGIDGPCGDRPAYAPTIGAGSGLVMRNIGTAIEERPGLSLKEIRADAMRLSGAGTTEYAQADGISALTAASAMALGLLVRDRTGVSQEMLTTMLTSTAHALADDMAEYKDRPPTAGRRRRAPGLLGPLPALPGGRRVDLPGRTVGRRLGRAVRRAGRRGGPGRRRPVRRRGGAAGQRRRPGPGARGGLRLEARPALGGHVAGRRRGLRRGAPRAARERPAVGRVRRCGGHAGGGGAPDVR